MSMEVGIDEKKQPHSPRRQAWLAGTLIALGVTLLCGGAMLMIGFHLVLAQDTGSGCGPRYEFIQRDFLSYDLTTEQPQASRNLTDAYAITILDIRSENETPFILTLRNSNGAVYLNITHPHPLTQDGLFGLEIGSFGAYDNYLILTIQRITNDTHVYILYDTFRVDRLCRDSANPATYFIITSITGPILIITGFVTLDKVGKEAAWQ